MHFRKNQIRGIRERAPAIAGQPRRHGRRAVIALLLAVFALAGGAQYQPVNPERSIQDPVPGAPPVAPAQVEIQKRQAGEGNLSAASAERKKQIADDGEMLLKLATDLKAEVDKTNKDTLSLTVIRKAAEIERVAHGVRDKLKPFAGSN